MSTPSPQTSLLKMFDFDTAKYAETYKKQGYVHIPNGITDEFYAVMRKQVEEYFETQRIAHLRVGDKLQALYHFPVDPNHAEVPGKNGYLRQFFEMVAGVCGLDADQLVLSERHIKAYEPSADPNPKVHKDRYSSQISIGLSVHVPPGSTLVLYPHDDLSENPFNSSTELRQSLTSDRTPEIALEGGKPVEILDAPGDLILFRGNNMWHLRRNAANTVMLYFKLNDYNCDTLGEDPRTEGAHHRSIELSRQAPEQVEEKLLHLGRKVEYFHRRIGRDGKEILGVVITGKGHVTVDEAELALLQAANGRQTAGELLKTHSLGLTSLKRLAEVGALELQTRVQPQAQIQASAQSAANPIGLNVDLSLGRAVQTETGAGAGA